MHTSFTVKPFKGSTLEAKCTIDVDDSGVFVAVPKNDNGSEAEQHKLVRFAQGLVLESVVISTQNALRPGPRDAGIVVTVTKNGPPADDAATRARKWRLWADAHGVEWLTRVNGIEIKTSIASLYEASLVKAPKVNTAKASLDAMNAEIAALLASGATGVDVIEKLKAINAKYSA